MNAEHHDERLDGLIRAAVGRDDLSFDFPRWKQRHVHSIAAFRSQPHFPSGPVRSFRAYVSLHHRPAAGLVAAAAVFAIVSLLLLGEGQQTLCAQTLRALEQARTLHVVTAEYRNGQHVKDHEIWYDRRAGIMEQERYENRTDVRIDNGQDEWRFAEGGKYAGRQRSYRDKDELVRDLCAGWLNYTPRRVSSGDTTVADAPCRMYVIADSGWTCSLWADEKDRVRRAELTEKGQPWDGETRSVMDIDYEAAIDPQRFEPRLDASMTVVDPGRFLEQQYPLAGALFIQESLGFTFAVHRLERCPDGLKYLVCSTRLTDETRRKIGATHPWAFYGSAHLRDVSAEPYYDRVELLAGLDNDGIRVEWYLLLPGGDQAAETAGCDVNVEIDTANQLAEGQKADGSPTTGQFRLVIPREKARQTQAPLEDLLGDIYSLGEQLDPIVHSFLLPEVVQSRRVQLWRRPGIQLSREQYIRNVQQRVTDWLNRN